MTVKPCFIEPGIIWIECFFYIPVLSVDIAGQAGGQEILNFLLTEMLVLFLPHWDTYWLLVWKENHPSVSVSLL